MMLFEIPIWFTGFNFLVALFGVIVLIGGALVVIMARKGVDASTFQVERATTAEGLIKLREIEKEEIQLKLAKSEEELEAVTAEHRTLVGLHIGELMEFWGQKEALEAEMADLRKDIRILKMRKDGDT